MAYDGYCYIPSMIDSVLNYTNAQLMITAVLIIPPQWARQSNVNCKQANQNFCAPDDPVAFGRFAGFLASLFNGRRAFGRITEFVIMNEVNAAEWYNIGCGNGQTCNIDEWVRNYARVYNAAYDRIRSEQKNAPVLISFEHHFHSSLDKYINNPSPVSNEEKKKNRSSFNK